MNPTKTGKLMCPVTSTGRVTLVQVMNEEGIGL